MRDEAEEEALHCLLEGVQAQAGSDLSKHVPLP